MTNYPRSAYGSNPNAGYPANGDKQAWGGYSWPGGVPTGFLGTTDYTSSFGQRIRVLMRRELVPLWNLLFAVMDRKHGYKVWAVKDGEVWGPWGYANRPVAGGSTPSGHSMALSVDINAPNNPYSYTFQSDMPPAMVADLESCGLYWGGRYTGKADAMHYGYCYPPGSVREHIARAGMLLGQDPPKPPTPTPEPGDDDVTDDDVKRIADEVIRRLKTDKIVPYNKVDAGSGKETQTTGTLVKAVGDGTTYAGRAAYRATKIDNGA